jgi:AsmA family
MANLTRGFWITLAALVSAIVLVVGLIGWGLSPSSLKPRLIAAVERATGRTMTVAGRIGIEFSLVPTVVMEDVSLANPPGFSRPDMVKIARVEVSLALMPLLQHRIEVDRIALVRPDIQLETDQAGRRNWAFARQPAPGGPTAKEPVTAAVPVGPGTSGFVISFFNTNVVDGHIVWVDNTPDASSGPRRIEAGLPQLSITAPEVGPVHLAGTVTYEGRTIGLTGRAGPDETVPRPGDGAPWPVALNLVAGDANMAVVGQIARPRELRGYSFTIDASVPDPSAFASLLPRYRLASCKAVTVHAGVTDSGQATPTISDLNIKAASVDIGILGIQARLENATFSAQGNSQGEAPISPGWRKGRRVPSRSISNGTRPRLGRPSRGRSRTRCGSPASHWM